MITETKSTVNFNFLTQAQYDAAALAGNINSGELYFTTDTVIGSAMLPVASTTTLGGVKIDGTTVIINNGVISAVGGSGGSNITPCTDAFEYYNGTCWAYHNPTDAPYPAELAHYAGYAYRACSAYTADSVAGTVCEATHAASADWAGWAGPSYGLVESVSNVNYSEGSKAVQYESNADEGDSTYVTICPLPPLGPFVVNLMVAYASETMTGSVNYLVCGSNLQITNISVLGGDNAAGNGLTLTSYFNISSAKLRLTKTFSNGCYTITAGNITTTATVCGRLVNNVSYCSPESSSCY